jgi:hypothetical protein
MQRNTNSLPPHSSITAFLALPANKRASSDLFVFHLSQKKISLQSNKTRHATLSQHICSIFLR